MQDGHGVWDGWLRYAAAHRGDGRAARCGVLGMISWVGVRDHITELRRTELLLALERLKKEIPELSSSFALARLMLGQWVFLVVVTIAVARELADASAVATVPH